MLHVIEEESIERNRFIRKTFENIFSVLLSGEEKLHDGNSCSCSSKAHPGITHFATCLIGNPNVVFVVVVVIVFQMLWM